MRRLSQRIVRELWTPSGGQFDGLNGLRGLASHLVSCFHVALFAGVYPLVFEASDRFSPLQRCMNGFWTGLDVFFVLSGFLIGRVLMENLERTGSVEFTAFFVRRSFRIFPTYYLVLAFAVFYFARLPKSITWLLLADSNWGVVLTDSWQNFTFTVNYFFHSGAPNAMSWSWFVCIEEHFYLVLPLLLALTFKNPRSRLRPLVLIAGIILPLLIRAIQYLHDPNIVLLEGFYYRTHNRVDELFYGVLLAYGYVFHRDKLEALVRRMGSATWILGTALILSVWIFGGLHFRGVFPIVFQFSFVSAGTALLVANCLFLDNRFTRFFAHRFWLPSARLSYGIYLIHPYVLFWLIAHVSEADRAAFGLASFGLLALKVIAISMIIAAFSYVLLERRLIALGRRVANHFERPAIARVA